MNAEKKLRALLLVVEFVNNEIHKADKVNTITRLVLIGATASEIKIDVEQTIYTMGSRGGIKRKRMHFPFSLPKKLGRTIATDRVATKIDSVWGSGAIKAQMV